MHDPNLYWKAAEKRARSSKTIASLVTLSNADSKRIFLTVISKQLMRRLRNSRLRHRNPVQCVGGKSESKSFKLENWKISNLISSFQRVVHETHTESFVAVAREGRAENGSCLRNKNLKQNNKRTNKAKKEQQHEHFRKININTARHRKVDAKTSISVLEMRFYRRA